MSSSSLSPPPINRSWVGWERTERDWRRAGCPAVAASHDRLALLAGIPGAGPAGQVAAFRGGADPAVRHTQGVGTQVGS